MAYTTPTRYCQEVGFEEARGQLLDDGRLLTADLLHQVLAVVAGGTWPATTTADLQLVAMAAHERLLRKLGTVSNYIDGYLRTVVALPIQAGDAALGTLEECCLALARDELASDSDVSTDLIVKRADRWRKWLVDVANQTTRLVSSNPQAPTVGGGRVVVGQAKSGFDWDRFGAAR